VKGSQLMNVFLTVLCGVSFMDAAGVSVIGSDNLFFLWFAVFPSVQSRLTAIGRRWVPIKRYYSIWILLALMLIGITATYSLSEVVVARFTGKSWPSFFILIIMFSLIEIFFPVKPRQKKSK
jgi:hypothetical protein